MTSSITGSVSQADVRLARNALRDAEEKLATVKRWDQMFESKVAPLAREPEKLRGWLSSDLPKATAYLKEVVNLLDDYADYAPSKESVKPPPEPEEDAP